MTETLGCTNNSLEEYNYIPAQYTSDWFSHNIGIWNNYKPFFFDQENMHCLEIGSWEGRSTTYTAKNYCNGAGSYVDAVDTWQGSVEHSDTQKNELYERFTSNLQKQIDNQKVFLHKDYSSNVLMKFAQEVRADTREKYNFIYIDGSHIAKDVLMDAVLSWEILKINGIVIFDDYEWDLYSENPNVMQPKAAIDGFLKVYAGMYTLLHKGYQIHIQKTADIPY